MFSLYIKIFRSFIYLSTYVLLSFHISFLPCNLNLVRTFYIFMFYQCCILCAPERNYILDIRCNINTIIIYYDDNTCPMNRSH